MIHTLCLLLIYNPVSLYVVFRRLIMGPEQQKKAHYPSTVSVLSTFWYWWVFFNNVRLRWLHTWQHLKLHCFHSHHFNSFCFLFLRLSANLKTWFYWCPLTSLVGRVLKWLRCVSLPTSRLKVDRQIRGWSMLEVNQLEDTVGHFWLDRNSHLLSEFTTFLFNGKWSSVHVCDVSCFYCKCHHFYSYTQWIL